MSGTKVSTPGTSYMLLLLLSSFFSTRHFADAACSPVVGGGFQSLRVMRIQKRHPEIQKRLYDMNLPGKWLPETCSDQNQVYSIQSEEEASPSFWEEML